MTERIHKQRLAGKCTLRFEPDAHQQQIVHNWESAHHTGGFPQLPHPCSVTAPTIKVAMNSEKIDGQ
jgi:hypothetical protein